MLMEESAHEQKPAVIPIKFWKIPVEKTDGSIEHVDKVRWQKIGDPNHVGECKMNIIEKMNPNVYKVIKPHYEAWKNSQEIPETGTPIDSWPAITSSEMADLLKTNGFLSVEAFAEATESDLTRLGMGARALREKAKKYVALLLGDGKLSSQLTNLEEENKDLKDKLTEMQEVIDSLRASKPKRGRPRKGEQI